ncbi:hypothetical protein D3C84_1039950 [compost metagenome]
MQHRGTPDQVIALTDRITGQVATAYLQTLFQAGATNVVRGHVHGLDEVEDLTAEPWVVPDQGNGHQPRATAQVEHAPRGVKLRHLGHQAQRHIHSHRPLFLGDLQACSRGPIVDAGRHV